jgi:hypothetical protein
MCRKLVLLARNDNQQMICTCEHGTIHLTHQNTTICMNRSVFETLVQQLMGQDLRVNASSGPVSIYETPDNHIGFWVDSGGWRFKFYEYVAFADLMREAVEKLPSLDMAKLTENRARFRHRPRHGYSLN